jgi:pilus assembly protein CpaF
MESKPANVEGRGQVTIRDLVRNSLRMRPDRIIIGECRGSEALDMLQAMNTGHEGSLSTLHANSPRDAMSRLETMVLMAGTELPLRAIRDQIASAMDLVVQLTRQRDGRRQVTEIAEVAGMEGDTLTLNQIFTVPRNEDGTVTLGGELAPTGIRPSFTGDLIDAGFDLPGDLFRPNLTAMMGRAR